MSGIYSGVYGEFGSLSELEIFPGITTNRLPVKLILQPIEVIRMGFICSIDMNAPSTIGLFIGTGIGDFKASMIVPQLTEGKGAWLDLLSADLPGSPPGNAQRAIPGELVDIAVVDTTATAGAGGFFVHYRPIGVTVADGRMALVHDGTTI